MAEPIRIGIVYPQLLGTYGDRGNAEVLAWRLRRRGHDAIVVELPAPQSIPSDLDAYVPALAVCGSLQLLGDVYLDRTGHKVPGMHMLDLVTTATGPRCVGEV